MNKYLLLRDNKQSGPYTVSELVQKGIKPYDLVWLDGKSAAWRYPSEVEELKEYSPTVEEQPFDRFYKKPEATTKPMPAPVPVPQQEHSAYVPKVEIEAASEDIQPPKKVYINFPVNPNEIKNVRPQQETDSFTQIKEHVPQQPSLQKQTYSEGFAENTFYKQASEVIAARSNKVQSEKKYVYGAIAACVVLIGFIAILLVNYNTQQERLRELNTIVKQIENNQASAPATQVKNEQPPASPAVIQPSETIVNPELLTTNDHNTPAAKDESTPVTPGEAKEKDAAPLANSARKPINDANGSVVFTERPVLRRGDVANNTPANIDEPPAENATENLYKLVSVKPNKYKTGVLGGITNLQLHLTNNSKRELHKVAVVIKYFGPEKKVVNQQTVYFENIAPGAESTIDVPKSKRGVTLDYTITDIRSQG